jgi:hypothetical protein
MSPSVGYVTAPGISDADYFSVVSFTVTGLQLDIYANAWRSFVVSEEIQDNDFQKNEQAHKRERLAMGGHGTGVVK